MFVEVLGKKTGSGAFVPSPANPEQDENALQ